MLAGDTRNFDSVDPAQGGDMDAAGHSARSNNADFHRCEVHYRVKNQYYTMREPGAPKAARLRGKLPKLPAKLTRPNVLRFFSGCNSLFAMLGLDRRGCGEEAGTR